MENKTELDLKGLGNYLNKELVGMTNISDYLPQRTIDAVDYQMQKNPKKAKNVEICNATFEAGTNKDGEKIASLWFDYNSEILYLETTDHSIHIINFDKYKSDGHYNEELIFDTIKGGVIYGNMFKMNTNQKSKSTNPDQNQPGSY